jgi:raffinose/stachyose/melibiose transport system substrate-binding protein
MSLKTLKITSLFLALSLLIFLIGCENNPAVKTTPDNSMVTNTPNSTVTAKSDTLENNANTSGSTNQSTIKIFQSKVEITEQFSQLALEYEKLNPNVKIQVETVGKSDYGTVLSNKFKGNEKPDIFMNSGDSDLDKWIDHLEDLSNEPWAKEMSSKSMIKDGKVYGQAVSVEGFGLLYNKDLFAKAGITEPGITEPPLTFKQLEDVVKKLQAAGIQPFINGYAEWWVLGNLFVNLPFAQQFDPNAFMDGLNNGTAKIPGNKIFEDWVKLFDLQLKYGNKNPLQTDYKTQMTDFAAGKAAMTLQGNWVDPLLYKINKDFKVGILPIPISDDPILIGKLSLGVQHNWVVHKNSPVKEEAKKFLNWMVSSDIGKRYMIEEFKFIPHVNSIEKMGIKDKNKIGSLFENTIFYALSANNIDFCWTKFPGGEATSKKFAEIMQAYVAKTINKDQMLTQFQNAWDSLK